MNIKSYIKKNGIERAFIVIYRYKLNILLVKVVSLFTNRKPLKNIIVIRSHNDFDCNGGAFYNYLIKNKFNEKYKIVWRLEHKAPSSLPDNVCTVEEYKPSIRKAYYYCMAKYFVADSNVMEKVRSDQVSYYFTHSGIAIKNVKQFMGTTKTLDFCLSPSEHYDEILRDQKNLSAHTKLLHFGFPFNDVLFEETEDELKKITHKHFKKVFLWMPTFRNGGGYQRNDSIKDMKYGIPLIETEEMMKKLVSFLEKNDFLLIVKIHPKQNEESYKELKSNGNMIVLDGKDVKKLNIDNYRLIKSADAMISDYSSIVYSYILLNRPIGFVLSDYKDYIPGFGMSNYEDFLVGHKIYNFEDFLLFFKDIANGKDMYKEKRENFANWIYKYKDGHSCERIVQHMGL